MFNVKMTCEVKLLDGKFHDVCIGSCDRPGNQQSYSYDDVPIFKNLTKKFSHQNPNSPSNGDNIISEFPLHIY
jgi:hypothetical protein